MRFLVVAAGSLLLACGSAGGQNLGSGIEGRVLVGPACPVVRADSPCPDTPGTSLSIEVRDSGNVVIERAQTDNNGRFRVSLIAGRYKLRTGGSGFPKIPSVDVEVRAGAYTSVVLHADSGIR
jgi:hypothetical protein